jgi:hypothetical protein
MRGATWASTFLDRQPHSSTAGHSRDCLARVSGETGPATRGRLKANCFRGAMWSRKLAKRPAEIARA